jgi:hypothetical protein
MPTNEVTPAPPAMPAPMGIYASGAAAPGMEPATIALLKTQGDSGAVSPEIVTNKGTSNAKHFGMLGGELNADNLAVAGWAVMYGASVSQKIKTNLTPLLELRKNQVGNNKLFKVLDPPAEKQSASDWLFAHKTSLNVVDPSMGVPYYILIVASPEDISFEFQYELDLYWAVGRLWLENEDDFERYAHSVVAYEGATKVPTARKMVVFAPDYSEKDNGTQKILRESLAKPLAATLGPSAQFAMQALIGKKATKAALHNIFSGTDGTPALLFTGTHGLLQDVKSEELPGQQGALLCQEYQGGGATPDTFYAAADLPAKAKVHGMVHFLYACYGVGYPRYDTYNYVKKAAIAPAPMMARLPQRLLGFENGALAVLGHIDRAWSCSFNVDGQPPQDQGFRDVLTKVMSGYRLGSATDQFNFRWAALTIPLADTLKRMQTRRGLDTLAANLWTIRNDARNYILHGDPAIKLRVSPTEMPPA